MTDYKALYDECRSRREQDREPTCPFCGDGLEAIGTLNHIECVEKLSAELAALKWRRCETCKSWDTVDAQTVAGVAYSVCSHKSARRHHDGIVRPGYWLCPCWTARAEEGGGS
jgi:hypothetical protein